MTTSPVGCVAKDCPGYLDLVISADGETTWGGSCRRCGRYNEKCQVCGLFFVQIWRHFRIPTLSDKPEEITEEKRAAHARATACLNGNPAWRNAKASKDMISHLGQLR